MLVKYVLTRYYNKMNDELFNLIERLANLLRQETRAEGQNLGLQPIQQEALYYLSTCNRYSDTTFGVTEFLGLTKGTVSQSLKVLEKKALIVRLKDDNDKRITHLKVTEVGSAFLNDSCPPKMFKEAICGLSPKDQKKTSTLLLGILQNYQKSVGRTAFGVCEGCKFNRKVEGGFLCELTNEPLTLDDTKLICREYRNN